MQAKLASEALGVQESVLAFSLQAAAGGRDALPTAAVAQPAGSAVPSSAGELPTKAQKGTAEARLAAIEARLEEVRPCVGRATATATQPPCLPTARPYRDYAPMSEATVTRSLAHAPPSAAKVAGHSLQHH